MASFVLVHGSWHAAWCWFKVESRLRAGGHEVIVPDLPSHGRDRTPIAEVTLESCVERVVEAMEAASAPVTLVAHSRGGIVATAAAESRPDLVSGLVYLAAFLPADGETVFELAPSDADSLILPNLDLDGDEGWDMLRREAFVPALYADCAEQDIALASALLAPEPVAPSLTPIRTSRERYGSLPRAYIELTEDRAVTLPFQRLMHSKQPCDPVVSLDAGHSAYFSKPDQLSDLLVGLAAPAEGPVAPAVYSS